PAEAAQARFQPVERLAAETLGQPGSRIYGRRAAAPAQGPEAAARRRGFGQAGRTAPAGPDPICFAVRHHRLLVVRTKAELLAPCDSALRAFAGRLNQTWEVEGASGALQRAARGPRLAA